MIKLDALIDMLQRQRSYIGDAPVLVEESNGDITYIGGVEGDTFSAEEGPVVLLTTDDEEDE